MTATAESRLLRPVDSYSETHISPTALPAETCCQAKHPLMKNKYNTFSVTTSQAANDLEIKHVKHVPPKPCLGQYVDVTVMHRERMNLGCNVNPPQDGSTKRQ